MNTIHDRDAILSTAMSDLEAERYQAVVEATGSLPDEGGPVGHALSMVAAGLLLEAAGQRHAAMLRLESAFGLGPALPAPALRALSGAFRRLGRPVLAHHASLMVELFEPGTLDETLPSLPLADRARYATWAMRGSWWARETDLYGLAPFKHALRERLGPESAALLLADLAGPDGPRRAARYRLTPLLDHALEAALDHEELVPAGPARSEPLRAHGQPDRGPARRRSRSLFGCILTDVIVTGRSSILLAGERALLDVQGDELSRRPLDLSIDPLVVAAEGDHVILLEPADRDALRREPEAVWLGGVHSVAWGHWIMEYLPKIWALMARPGFSRVPLLVDAGMPDQHLESVRLFAGDENPVHVLEPHAAIRVGRLWVASALAYLPIGPLPGGPADRTRNGVDDEALVRLMDRLTPSLAAVDESLGPDRPSRVYLARKETQHRRLVNGAEIEATLAAHGFVRHDLADLPFVEQLRIVRGADHVIGPSGSALLTCIFGRPGLRIGALMPPGATDVAWLNEVSRSRGFSLSVIYGTMSRPHERYPWMSDYDIDPESLADYLGREVQEPPQPPDVRVSP